MAFCFAVCGGSGVFKCGNLCLAFWSHPSMPNMRRYNKIINHLSQHVVTIFLSWLSKLKSTLYAVMLFSPLLILCLGPGFAFEQKATENSPKEIQKLDVLVLVIDFSILNEGHLFYWYFAEIYLPYRRQEEEKVILQHACCVGRGQFLLQTNSSLSRQVE